MSLDLESQKRFAQELIRDYHDGEVIFSEGDEGRDLFVIQRGAVRVSKKTAQGELQLAEFTKGDFFGDMALLQSVPRFATARAVGETRLLTIQPGGFLLKIRRDPTFAFEMLQQLSQRVRIASERALEIARHAGLSQQQVEEILRQFERKPL